MTTEPDWMSEAIYWQSESEHLQAQLTTLHRDQAALVESWRAMAAFDVD
jgi:hypothetical protein